MPDAPQPTPTYAPDTLGLGRVLAGVALVAVVGGTILARQYAEFNAYIRATVEFPQQPKPWLAAGMTPETCVDQAMSWAASCSGIKGLCDEYVPRVMEECLKPLPLDDYCKRLNDVETRARLGQRECASRGVRPEVDAQACSKAYQSINDRCSFENRQRASRMPMP